jgi:hypothetical protein
MISTVRVTGTIRDASGTLYEGAVVEAYLDSPLLYNGVVYSNEVLRTYTDSYGKFYFDLIPSVYDADKENFYHFKIIQGTTTTYQKIVPGNNQLFEFETLADYTPQALRTPLLGNINHTVNPNPVTLPQELVGMFAWTSFHADGNTNVFSAPGEIYIVALNGIIQSSGDYTKQAPNIIEFVSTPLSGDLVAIQFRI